MKKLIFAALLAITPCSITADDTFIGQASTPSLGKLAVKIITADINELEGRVNEWFNKNPKIFVYEIKWQVTMVMIVYRAK